MILTSSCLELVFSVVIFTTHFDTPNEHNEPKLNHHVFILLSSFRTNQHSTNPTYPPYLPPSDSFPRRP
jgi:hypothetical protein